MTKSPAKAETNPDARRDAPPWCDPQASERARKASLARNRSTRRRRVDPTTCERDYSLEELEFMRAIEAYKAASNRKFPTWSEVLQIIRILGYEKGRAGQPLGCAPRARPYRPAATA